MFLVIPAIDLLDTKTVRLLRGEYDQSTIYGDDPAARALAFVEAGAELVHLVDLNAARSGDRSVNRRAVSAVLEAVKGRARVELGGGIRNMDALDEVARQGVDRFVLGTAALKDPAFLRAALNRYGKDRIIAGVDVKDGTVRVSGWEKDGGVRTEDFLKRLEDTGIEEIIFTDIQTDGALTGPPVQTLRSVLSACGLRVIASGGIASNADLVELALLKEERLIGAITGRAVYEGKVDLALAIQQVKSAL